MKQQKISYSCRKCFVLLLLLLITLDVIGATKVSSISSGNWSSPSIWVATRTGTITCETNSAIVTGINTNFTTELSVGVVIKNFSQQIIGTVQSISSNTSLTLTSNAAIASSSISYYINIIPGNSDSVYISEGHDIVVDNDYTCATLTFNPVSFTNNKLTLSDNKTLTVNAILMNSPLGGQKSSNLNIGNGKVICTQLSLYSNTNTRRADVNIINGTLEINGPVLGQNITGNKITITGSGIIKFGGDVDISNITLDLSGTNSTIFYNANANQTCFSNSYYNLVLGGTGTKTVTGCTVTNLLRIDSTATLNEAITYGAAGGLKYNTTQNRTASSYEWPTPFTGTGGVTIANTGTITLNELKSFGIDADLTILSNGKLNTSTSNFGLTFYADFYNYGTLITNASTVTIANIATSQTIGTFTTTGDLKMTKSAGTARLTGNITAGNLILDGYGSTLSCGSNNTHNFTKFQRTAGTLRGSTSTINFTDSALAGSGTFVADTSTVRWISNESAQDIASLTYYNLEFGGSSIKTTYSLTTITNNFVMSGTASTTTTANLSIGGNFTIGNGNTFNIGGYDITVSGNTTVGNGNGGTINFTSVSGTKTFNSDFTINTNGNLTSSVNATIKIVGNLTNNGTVNIGSSKIELYGSSKTISGTSQTSFSNLSIYGTYTLNSNIIIIGTLAGSGTLTVGASATLNINTSVSPTITSLNTSTVGNTVVYGYAGNQTMLGQNYYNLSLSNSGNKTLQVGTSTIEGTLTISGTATTTLVRNLDINGNISLTGTGVTSLTTTSFKINIAGNINIINRDQLNFAGTLEMDGGAQSFTSTGGTSIPIANLILSGGVKTFNSTMYISTLLTINSGSTYKFGSSTAYELEIKNISGIGIIAAKACGTSGNRLIISGSATNVDIYMDATLYHIATISNVKTSGNLNFKTPIAISSSLVLPTSSNTYTVFYDELNFYGSTFSISNLSDKLIAGGPNSSLKIGGCSTLGGAITLPNGIFNSSPVTLKNLTIDRAGGLVIANQLLKVTRTLTLNNGSLTTNGNLVLTSTSTQTARVAPVVNDFYITGNITVERFIPGGSNKRKWRLLSSPINVSGSTALNQFKDDIYVTAPAGESGNFDVSPSNTASIRTYTESVSGSSNLGWTDPTHIDNTIETGTGIEVFVRGSRNLANPYNYLTVPDDVTIDFIGSLNIGTYSKSLSYTRSVGGATTADGFNLVGNPYASPINFDTTIGWTKTNIENKFWCYNPNTSNYGVYDATLHTGTNEISKYIASGQAFFVRATSENSPNLTFTENVKCVQTGNNYFKSANEPISFPLLRISLFNNNDDFDETLIAIDSTNGSNSANDLHDAAKFFNDALNIYSVTKNKSNLAINSIGIPNQKDTINLSVWSYDSTAISKNHHQLRFSNSQSINSSIYIYLLDNYLNSLIDIRKNEHYDFLITEQALSYGNNRFKIIFSNSPMSSFEDKLPSQINVFPNPTDDRIFIENFKLDKGDTEYILFDLAGREIVKGVTKFYNNKAEINMEGLERGHYLLKLGINNNFTFHQIIKK